MNSTASRSVFVTVVAWIFIVLSGFGTMMAILQNIMLYTVFSGPEMQEALQAQPQPGVPPFASFMFGHFHLFFFAFLVFSFIMLASSIGLLQRKNWARLTFVALMVFGIIWNMGGLVLQFSMFSSMQEGFAQAPGAKDMQPFMYAVVAFSVIFAVGFSVLLAWIAKRLLSPSVVAEFKQ